MAKKLSKRADLFIVILVVLFVVIGAYFLVQHRFGKTPPLEEKKISAQSALLVDVAVWYPSAPWSEPALATMTTTYGDLSGESITATVQSPTASLDHFEMQSELSEKGFIPDTMLAADGPGSSTWGYKREENGLAEVLVLSYETKPSTSNSNEPIQFNCPCEITVTAFASTPFNPTTPN